MRVIAGKAKGHKLVAPKSDRVRPALDQVKEAIFNILFDVEGLSVLDLFAGSGSVGIEALSRGAKRCVFVEEWQPAINSIITNLEHTKLKDSAKVIKFSVKKAINFFNREGSQFDLIFVDPPYEKDLVNKTLEHIAGTTLIHDDTIIVVEHHPKEPISEDIDLTITDSRKYGQTYISFLKR